MNLGLNTKLRRWPPENIEELAQSFNSGDFDELLTGNGV
jgi:hypothetical protein